MLHFEISEEFRVRKAPAAEPTPGSRAVFSARARAKRDARTRKLLSALVLFSTPLLAYKAHLWGRPPSGAANAANIVASVTKRKATTPTAPVAEMAKRPAREEIDFTATSATCPSAAADPSNCGGAARKAKRQTRKRFPGFIR